MSKSWAGGSTSAWRRMRARVLHRDKYLCQLRLPGCTIKATQVHHVLGRSVSGDDPRYLVASCRSCNLLVGDPTKSENVEPEPKRITRW